MSRKRKSVKNLGLLPTFTEKLILLFMNSNNQTTKMTFNTDKAFSDTKKVLGIIAVVCTSLIMALNIIHKEVVKEQEKTEETTTD